MKREGEAGSIAIRAVVALMGSDSLPHNAEEAENHAFRVLSRCVKVAERWLVSM